MIRGRPPHLASAWLLVLAAAAWTPLVAQAQEEPALVKRQTELRESPGDAGLSLASLPAESGLTRLGERQGPWIRVRTAAGVTGWVHLFDIAPRSAPATPPANGATAALRGVASFFTKPAEQRAATPTSTIGIRGLGAEDLAQAQPDSAGVARMETLRVAEPQARQFARDAGWGAILVDPLPAPPRTSGGGQQP